MKMLIRWQRVTLLAVLLLVVCSATGGVAGELTIAVASNFQVTAKQLATAFERETGHQVQLSFGSTGLLYAQIHHGAPFDIFFAADEERPRQLEAEGVAVERSRFTYAYGQSVLWSAKPGYILGNGEVLRKGNYAHIALANPKLAPYGLATQQTLTKLGLWERLRQEGRLVMGQNIGQTHQMIASGSVPLGFVALSQIQRPDHRLEGSYWVIPARLYKPIVQQAVLLHETPLAWTFLAFVRSDQGRRIIKSHGYTIPAGKK